MRSSDLSPWLRRLRDAMGASGASSPSDRPAFERYDVLEVLGEGAMAVVFRARDRKLDRPVALKVLKDVSQSREVVRRRLEREAKAVGSLVHPNVVAVHDFGEEGGRTYLAMELVPGSSLAAILHEGGRTRRALVELVEQVARGVAHAHAHGVVHRDLKPANILVPPDGAPKVGDFGLAFLLEADEELTRAGATLGTPAYMAPEQAGGHRSRLSPATDVYALGAILYEILTGLRPHEGGSSMDLYVRIQTEDPRSPRSIDPSIPADLETIVLKSIEREPRRRYPDAAALADDLRRWLDGEAVLARAPSLPERLWRRTRRHRTLLTVASAALVLAGTLLALTVEAARRRDADARLKHHTEILGRLETGREAIDRAERESWREQFDAESAFRRAEEGQVLVEKALEEAPHLALGHFLRGRAWDFRGHEEQAEASYREALRLDPGMAPARLRLGRLLFLRHYLAWYYEKRSTPPVYDPALAAGLNAAATELSRALGAKGRLDGEVDHEIMRAMIAHCGGDLAGVERIASNAIERLGGQEGCAEIYWLLGHVRTGDDGIRAIHEAVKLRPGYALALFSLADHGRLRGLHAKALPFYDRAIRSEPRRVIYRVNRANCRLELGDAEGAVADCSEALRLRPETPQALQVRAAALLALNRKHEARADAEEALRLDPGFAIGYSTRGTLKRLDGDLRGAIEDFTKSIELGAGKSAPHMERGIARQALGDLAGAEADFSEAARLAPGDPDAFLYRGVLRKQSRSMAAAAEDLTRALELAREGWKSRVSAIVHRSETRRILGDIDGAIADATEAIRSHPDLPDAWRMRALARGLRNADVPGAVEDARKALEIAPAGWDGAERMRRILENADPDSKREH